MAYAVDMSNFPEWFMDSHRKLSPQAKQKWLDDRYRALTDHLFLGVDVMEMDFQVTPHKWLFAKMLQKRPGVALYDLDLKKKKRLILWSRGTFKTSSIVVEIVQLILNYPDIRICFMSGADQLAKAQLQRVKRYFEQPPKKFRELFPDFIGKKLGNQSQFTVPCRTNLTFAEPTMKISTAKSVKASQHFDAIFVDDLVHESNYKSQKSLDACIDSYKGICPLLAPDGFMYVTGTRWTFNDLYEDIQRLAEKEIAELGTNPWLFSIKSCWVRICSRCGHNDAEHDFDSDPDGVCANNCGCRHFEDSGRRDVLFPKFRCKDGRTEGHDMQFLQSERIRLTPEFFSCNYENNPIAEGTQTFTDELIGAQTLFHENQWPSALQAPCFIVGDLSYVGDDKRDLSVFYVVRRWLGQLYIVDCSFGKWDAMGVANEMFTLAGKHRPTLVLIEQFLGWQAYDTVFNIFARDKDIQKLPIQWQRMTNSKDAKRVRIGGIKGWLAQRRLWICSHIPGYDTLVDQLKKWPKLGRHDDFADCLGLVCEAPTGVETEAAPRPDMTSLSYIRQLHRLPDVEEYDTRIPGTY